MSALLVDQLFSSGAMERPFIQQAVFIESFIIVGTTFDDPCIQQPNKKKEVEGSGITNRKRKKNIEREK